MKKSYLIIFSGVALMGLLLVLQKIEVSQGSAPIGLPATVATTSTIVVGLQEELVIFNGESAGRIKFCSSRVISTRADPILINFAGTSSSTATTTVLSSVEGHLQAASTTSVYDSGLYGCGYWGARSVGSGSTTITIMESF